MPRKGGWKGITDSDWVTESREIQQVEASSCCASIARGREDPHEEKNPPDILTKYKGCRDYVDPLMRVDVRRQCDRGGGGGCGVIGGFTVVGGRAAGGWRTVS